ncbi:RelB DinJ family addiction module antitoxin [Lacticaseibacillus zeae DSM 20178 = KCTC 3804]|uniref:RelB DinJ family addiction module antitoxin n=1 Tax=Lacticaseibacillus zeae DSM 20178 = KCTC 3804 TaxID=1423816 RepID=A0A0R1ETL7_LACZE|nr:RelB DinJ family addiction module antitoxin [Lacticaseibacillus zeae DSM 20178 = KCTC 3804]
MKVLQDREKKKVTIAVKVSQADQQRATEIFESLGLDLATAINIFIKKSIAEGGFPFEIKDPFYSEANQAELSRRFQKVASSQDIHSRQLSENGK